MDFPTVHQTYDRRTCILVGEGAKPGTVRYVRSDNGVTEVLTLPIKEFEKTYTEIPNYPVLRAARLYLNPLSAAIEITADARKALTKIVNQEAPTTTIEELKMNQIEASSTEAQQNVNATVKAGLRTGTKGADVKKATETARAAKKAAKAPAKKAAAKPAKKATPTEVPTTNEVTTVSKKTTKKAAKKAPAKKAAATPFAKSKPVKKAPAKKAAKPASKGGAAKLVKKSTAKGYAKAPAKKAASGGGRTTGGTIIKVNPKNERVLKNGAVKKLFDFVASKGVKGVSRDEAYTHMLKHDKEEGADQRTRYNISWCVFKGIFIRA